MGQAGGSHRPGRTWLSERDVATETEATKATAQCPSCPRSLVCHRGRFLGWTGPDWALRVLTGLCLQSQDCIAAALACSKILKELSKEEEDMDSLEEMLALADEFELRAIGEPGPGSQLSPGSVALSLTVGHLDHAHLCLGCPRLSGHHLLV